MKKKQITNILNIMKKRAMILVLAASMLTSTLTGCGTSGDANVTADETNNAVMESADEKGHSIGKFPEKEEIVYVMADANGKTNSIIVSDWLKNTKGLDLLEDFSDLPGIVNISGDEEFVQNEDGTINWQANGNDIHYQGISKKELPVDVKITYFLDGKEVDSTEIAGKSGNVKIRFDYTNNEKKKVNINGKEKEIYVPFTMVSGIVLDSDHFSNVEVTNGKIINTGDANVALGITFPGIKDSLRQLDVSDSDIKEKAENISIPEFVEITADAKDFTLSQTMTLASSDLLSELSLSNEFDMKGISESMDDLKDGTDSLVDGTGALSKGAAELMNGAKELSDKSFDLADGANKLLDGSIQLDDGALALADGANSLNDGVGKIKDGTGTLKEGAIKLADGTNSLLDGADSLKDGAGKLHEGMENLNDGAAKLVNGADSLKDGIKAVDDGVSQLKNGAASLDNGIGELNSGAKELKNGTGKLLTGAESLNDGMSRAGEGVGNVNNMLVLLDKSIVDNRQNIDTLSVSAKELYDLLKNSTINVDNEAVIADYNNQINIATIEKEGASQKLSEVKNRKEEVGGQIEALKKNGGEEDKLTALEQSYDALCIAESGYEEAVSSKETVIASLSEAVRYLTAYSGNDQEKQLAVSLAKGVADGVDSLNTSIYGLPTDVKDTSTYSVTFALDVMTGKYPAISGGMPELVKGMEDLKTGANGISEGVKKLDDGASALVSGTVELKEGSGAMVKGTSNLADGSGQLLNGASELKSGINSLSEGAVTLSKGSKDLYSGAAALKNGTEELNKGSKDLAEGTKTLDSGTTDLSNGAKELANGAYDLWNGTGELTDGCRALTDGTDKFTDGTSKLYEGTVTVSDGMEELLAGTTKLSNEGIDKIVRIFEDDLQEISSLIDAIEAEGGKYNTFTGVNKDMAGSVKFIYKTEAVKME